MAAASGFRGYLLQQMSIPMHRPNLLFFPLGDCSIMISGQCIYFPGKSTAFLLPIGWVNQFYYILCLFMVDVWLTTVSNFTAMQGRQACHDPSLCWKTASGFLWARVFTCLYTVPIPKISIILTHILEFFLEYSADFHPQTRGFCRFEPPSSKLTIGSF